MKCSVLFLLASSVVLYGCNNQPSGEAVEEAIDRRLNETDLHQMRNVSGVDVRVMFCTDLRAEAVVTQMGVYQENAKIRGYPVDDYWPVKANVIRTCHESTDPESTVASDTLEREYRLSKDEYNDWVAYERKRN